MFDLNLENGTDVVHAICVGFVAAVAFGAVAAQVFALL